jgi:hypothetical protein
MTIELKFIESGDAYESAKSVADRMGLTVHAYLLQCIAEGHAILSARLAQTENIELPAFERRRSIQSDMDVDEELRKLREQTLRRDPTR